jgi:CHAT domain-containing protein
VNNAPVAHAWSRYWSPLAAVARIVLLAASGCVSQGPIERLSSVDTLHEGAAVDLGEWNGKWRALQDAPETVSLGDHWRVCEIKFRFRIYGDLFRCLELIEARVSRLDENAPPRRYAPVLTGWMRATAYAELGQTAEAVKWAETAWNALPQEYHDVSRVFHRGRSLISLVGQVLMPNERDFAGVAIEAGGSEQGPEGRIDLSPGQNNPAGLDLRPQAIAMDLAAARVSLHQQLGDTQQAQAAQQDLNKWRDASTGFPSFAEFQGDVSVISMAPLFAKGDYAAVIKNYQEWADSVHSWKFWHNWGYFSSLGTQLITEKIFSDTDTRKFAVSLEEVSREFLYGASLARLGRTDEARAVFDAMVATPELRQFGSIYWATLYESSQIAQKQGRSEEAIKQLQQAADAVDQVRSSIDYEASKIGFAGRTQDVYASLFLALAAKSDWKGAFLAAERAKARALVDMLAQLRSLPAPAQADARVRELLARASANDGGMGFRGGTGGADVRGAVASARSELGRVAPEAASLVSVQSIPIAEIAAQLAPDETLIDYFEAGGNPYALVLNGTTVAGFQLSGAELRNDVRRFRAAVERGEDTAGEGRSLYDRLIRPIAGGIRGTRLTISPHGVLHYLPFAALLDSNQYLIDRYGLRITPSASTLAYLRNTKPNAAGTLLALGNPDLGDPEFDLPSAQQEAIKVAGMFPDSRVLLRSEATKAAVFQLGPGFSRLHFASHAVFEPRAPLHSGLLLAKGNESDGRLTVSDLYSLRLDADLVTLSACETALGEVMTGDDVIGLERGFLYAGARSIIASLWSVADLPTEKLMISFYQKLGHVDKREALRLAQIETRKTYPSPRFWAAFEIAGSTN